MSPTNDLNVKDYVKTKVGVASRGGRWAGSYNEAVPSLALLAWDKADPFCPFGHEAVE